ncbi:MAG: hypothetical protein CMG74_02850 [Candidatus Marinimicrobia bacterium]|nr:hypothetical protein [Candidatus Neomarinimicrobiota bacterium]
MATFYIELKELRKSKGISLEQIHDRTKINIRYLRAVEAGDFDILPIPYLRLFLKAYADEIGGNSNRALEQLDSFLGTSSSQITPLTNRKEDQIEDHEFSGLGLERLMPGYPNQKIRDDFIKAGILLIIFIFIIIISQKIFNQESSAAISENGTILKNETNIISNEELTSGYLQDQFSEELLPTNSPFTIKLIPRKDTAFSFKVGGAKPLSHKLLSGVEKTLEKFNKKSQILFTHVKGLSIFINGYAINTEDHQHPVRLTIKPTNPPSLVIQKYQPLQ